MHSMSCCSQIENLRLFMSSMTRVLNECAKWPKESTQHLCKQMPTLGPLAVTRMDLVTFFLFAT